MNIVELLLKQFGGETLTKLTQLVGGSSGDIEKAIKAVIPTLLAGLSGMVSSPAGTDKVVSALKSVDADGGFDLDSILKGGPAKTEEMTKKGTSILEGLLGKGSLVALLGVLGKFLGNSGLITKLLPLLAPLAMSMISKQMKSGGLDIGGLAKILLGQKSNILGALPPGLGDALKGVQGLGELGNLLGSAGDAASAAGKVATQAAEEAASAGSKLLPIAAVAALLALAAWYFLGRGGNAVEDVKKGAAGAGKAVTEAAGKVADKTKDAVEGVKEKANDLLGTAGEEVLGNVKSFFTDITGALDEVKDTDTATAAVPKIEGLQTTLESLVKGATGLPEVAQPLIAEFVKGASKTLSEKVEAVLGIPGVSEILKPILDKVTTTLAGFSKS